MDIEKIKALVKDKTAERINIYAKFDESQRYYDNKNDITNRNNGESKLNEKGKNDPLRAADNRVSNNFHQPIVDQKAAYLATVAPQIDVGDDHDLNDKLLDILGDGFSNTLFDLVVDASNAGLVWLHYWIDSETQTFRFGIIPAGECTPVYDNFLEKNVVGMLRTYKKLDQDSGKNIYIHEYWNDSEVQMFQSQPYGETGSRLFQEYQGVDIIDVSTQETVGTSNTRQHELGKVPFIAFRNNKRERRDLDKYKGLIDVYDKVYNGFVNDVDDVQQVILVLTNYSGTNLGEFRRQLVEDKAIKLETSDSYEKAGVDTLTIDIPIEARESLLNNTRDAIYYNAQAVNPNKIELGNNTGVAIKMLYSQLELKAGVVEKQFRIGISHLVRAILRHLGISDSDKRKITQTWTRTSITNNVEQATVLQQLADVSSIETVAKNNPLVDDWQEEVKRLKEERETGHDSYEPQ
ncbi:phage portal protein [Leuconostoc carnosum]|uniref:phage portal protein n=1 Tax=Leuconostoc TaxID=1243 RepID=UPI0012396DCD|nr:phage portal protein [Leuconostoc carnosum]KAA8371114.1 phage portal protein [Leuconostoc carnosum]KAA8382755.1 phage portal protein [Leuconostoc carnosum]